MIDAPCAKVALLQFILGFLLKEEVFVVMIALLIILRFILGAIATWKNYFL
jgi:hypothetical protein